MPLAIKEIIRPGVYWHVNRATGKPEKLPVDKQYVQYLCDQGKEMLAAGLSIPVPLEHDVSCKAMNGADKAAADLRNNCGWVHSYHMKGDRLFAQLDVQDPALYAKLPKTVRYTSPWLNSFTDGNGKEWNGVISHVALTSRPRITQQEPFANFQAALSLATDGVLDKKLPDPGVFISRAGLLDKEGDGYKPRYSAAFSMLTSNAQLGPDFPPKKDEKPAPKKEEGPPKAGAGDGQTPPSKDGAKPGEKGGDVPGKDGASQIEGGAVEGIQEEELDLAEIMCDLVSALWGIELPEDTDESNCLTNVLRALMEHLKSTGGQIPGNEPPPTATKPGMGTAPVQQRPNPVMQEQAPMYMSLTADDVAKITDPDKKAMAEAILSLRGENERDRKQTDALRTNRLNEFKVSRDQRIEKLCKRVPTGTADKIRAMVAGEGAALSLGDDGGVKDPLNDVLTILEGGLKDIPAMLLGQANYQEVAHPVEPGGPMTKERAEQVAEEMAKPMGVTLVKA